MALINKAVNEITIKLVYYGPGLCGKTTNLEKVYSDPKLGGKGKMLSVATETDRTLFFDFMPMEVGTIRGQKVRVQLYTVPGQVFYDATRRLVLRGADGVVFVADSQRAVAEANLESFRNLRDNLVVNRIDPDKIPIVLQYNKRDLKDIHSVDELDSILNPDKRHPTFEAVALASKGVRETLQKGIALILASIGRGVDLTLHDNLPTPARPIPPRPSTVATPVEPPAPPVEAPPPPSPEPVAPPPPPPARPPVAVAPPPKPVPARAPVVSPAAVFADEEDPFAEAPRPAEATPPAPSPAPAPASPPPEEIPFLGRTAETDHEPPPALPTPPAPPRPRATPRVIEAPPEWASAALSEPSEPLPATKPPVRKLDEPPAKTEPPAVVMSPQLLNTLLQANEQTLRLLRSIAEDLEEQQRVLRRALGKG
jgi:signal recognition particle receptor subunit beta